MDEWNKFLDGLKSGVNTYADIKNTIDPPDTTQVQQDITQKAAKNIEQGVQSTSFIDKFDSKTLIVAGIGAVVVFMIVKD